jgi:hypothetical protein
VFYITTKGYSEEAVELGNFRILSFVTTQQIRVTLKIKLRANAYPDPTKGTNVLV